MAALIQALHRCNYSGLKVTGQKHQERKYLPILNILPESFTPYVRFGKHTIFKKNSFGKLWQMPELISQIMHS